MAAMDQKSGGGTVVICLGIAIGGFLATSWLWQHMQLGLASEKWPKTAGVILERKMTRNIEATPDPQRDSNSWGGSRRRRAERVGPDVKFDVLIRYEYEVEGKTYESTRITFAGLGLGFMEEPAARELLKRYGPNDEIEVHYNPDNPSEATLETGVVWWMYLVIAVTSLVTLFTAWTAWATFRHTAG